jgi:hypothetical protein
MERRERVEGEKEEGG